MERSDAAVPEVAVPATADPTPSPSRPLRGWAADRGRVTGIDVARFVAVIGMVLIHVGPLDVDGAAGTLYALPHGRAAILFVLLAGVGTALLAGDRSRPRLRRTWQQLLWRAAVLLPLGLWLQDLDHGILVILHYYALYFVVAALAAPLRDRVLLVLAVAALALTPVLYLGIWHLQPEWFVPGPTRLGEPWPVIARRLLLTGSYPVLVWSAPLLLGLWLGRRDLRDARVARRMAGWGAAVTATAALLSWALTGWIGEPVAEPSWALLATAEPHDEMPLWLLGSTGTAVAVLGLCLLLASRLPRATWPLAAAGQLAFTIYVGHLLVLDAAPELLRAGDVGGATLRVLRFAVVVVAASTLWRLVLPRGPLELLLRPPWTWGRRRPLGVR